MSCKHVQVWVMCMHMCVLMVGCVTQTRAGVGDVMHMCDAAPAYLAMRVGVLDVVRYCDMDQQHHVMSANQSMEGSSWRLLSTV